MTAANDVPDLWGLDDIASYLGKARATIARTVVTHPRFPKPLPGSRQNRRWFKDEVIDYLRERRAA